MWARYAKIRWLQHMYCILWYICVNLNWKTAADQETLLRIWTCPFHPLISFLTSNVYLAPTVGNSLGSKCYTSPSAQEKTRRKRSHNGAITTAFQNESLQSPEHIIFLQAVWPRRRCVDSPRIIHKSVFNPRLLLLLCFPYSSIFFFHHFRDRNQEFSEDLHLCLFIST